LLRTKRFWLGLVISLTFLAIFVYRTDIRETIRAFGEADYVLAFAAVPLYFVGFWIRTIRWRLLLRPVGSFPILRLYPVVLISLMANNVMPARVGELVRAFLVGEREKVSKSAALGTIAVDRTFDGLTLVAILGVVVAVTGTSAGVKGVGIATALAFAAATIMLATLAFSPGKSSRFLLKFARFLPSRLEQMAEGMLESFMSGLASLRSPGVLILAGIASFASWSVEAFMYYLVGEAFGLGVGFHVYLLIAAGANLALSILASPGGIGPFEATTQAILAVYLVSPNGVPPVASAYAVALHALLLGPVILVGLGLLWLIARRGDQGEFSFREMMGAQRVNVEKPTAAPPAD
jgi:glycosyltransferase 2 family protein